MVQIVRDATGRVNTVEDGILADRVGSSRARLGALRRVLVRRWNRAFRATMPVRARAQLAL
jgi:hypothetical protein